jgi:hypothetical protein
MHAPRACRRTERHDWTDEEIWDVVTNEGRSVDPFVVLNAPTFKTLNPMHMPDWASQGIEYVDDIEDWITQEGRWMEQDEYAKLSVSDSDDEEDEDVFDPVQIRPAVYLSVAACLPHAMPHLWMACIWGTGHGSDVPRCGRTCCCGPLHA